MTPLAFATHCRSPCRPPALLPQPARSTTAAPRATNRRTQESSRRRAGASRTPGDEHVLPALVLQWAPLEVAVERFELEARNVDQAEPLVLRRPPEGARCAAVEDDVHAVVGHRVPDRVRDGLVLLPPVQRDGDGVVEREGIPREPAARPQRAGNALERPPSVLPGREMQQRAERAVDESRRLLELQVAYVVLPQVELGTGLGGTRPRVLEHRRRGVDSDHPPPGLERDRDRDAPRADRELHDRPVGLAGQRDVERDVGRHRRRPLLVAGGERLGPAHERRRGPRCQAPTWFPDGSRSTATQRSPSGYGGVTSSPPSAVALSIVSSTSST